jgi:hypothetical protein
MADRQQNVIEVASGEYVPIPGTSATVLEGPGKLVVTRYPDGSVTGLIEEGSTTTTDWAVRRHLRRISWGI